MSKPYSYSSNKQGSTYSFCTQHGVEYAVYFEDGSNYFSRYPSISPNVLVFGFQASTRIPLYDPRVRYTIIEIIISYFMRNKHMALMFVCDQTDHRQAARNRVFNSWFTSADDYLITKLDQSICSDDNVSCAYLSIMYHSENDKAHQLENAFVNLSKDIDNK